MTRAGLILAGLMALAPNVSQAAPAVPIKGQFLLQAEALDYDVDKHIVTAQGHVEIDSDNRILLADQVSYDQDSDTVTATGHVSITDEKGNVAFADHVTLGRAIEGRKSFG